MFNVHTQISPIFTHTCTIHCLQHCGGRSELSAWAGSSSSELWCSDRYWSDLSTCFSCQQKTFKWSLCAVWFMGRTQAEIKRQEGGSERSAVLLTLSESQRGQAIFEIKSLIKDKQSVTAAHLGLYTKWANHTCKTRSLKGKHTQRTLGRTNDWGSR